MDIDIIYLLAILSYKKSELFLKSKVVDIRHDNQDLIVN